MFSLKDVELPVPLCNAFLTNTVFQSINMDDVVNIYLLCLAKDGDFLTIQCLYVPLSGYNHISLGRVDYLQYLCVCFRELNYLIAVHKSVNTVF